MAKSEDIAVLTECMKSIAISLGRISEHMAYQSNLMYLEAVRNGHAVNRPPQPPL